MGQCIYLPKELMTNEYNGYSDRKSTRLNSSHVKRSRMPSSAWFDKRFMYEESFHTPLIISYPKHIPSERAEKG